MYGDYGSSLRDLPRLRDSKRRRASSWDRTGGNDDRLTIRPGETAVLADIEGPGSINHIWCTLARDSAWGPDEVGGDYLRKLILRITWEDSSQPSVLVPLGDFFGVGHGKTVNFVSAPLQMSPQDGLGHFHASYNRQNPADGVPQASETLRQYQVEGTNLDGAGNYVVLDTEGKGHYVGCVVSIRNLRDSAEWNWSGEISLCRFHIEDPITFFKSIRVTIEHGHANKRSDDWSSVAYWYQTLKG